MTKRRAVMAGGAVLLVGGLLAALPLLIDKQRLLGQVKSQLEPQLKRQVSLGGGDFSVLPPRVSVDSFAIAEDPAIGGSRPFATAKRLEVRVGFWALLRGNVEVQSITLRQPVIELVRKPDGTWNYESIGGDKKDDAGSPLSIQRFEVEDGTVGVMNLGEESKRAVYEHIDLRLQDFTPGKRFELDASARLQGAKDSTIAFSGAGSGATDVEGKITFKNASVAAVEKFLNQAASGFDMDLTGDLEIRRKGDVTEVKGGVQTPSLRYKGRAADLPARVDLDVAADTKAETVRIARAEAKFGSASLSATGEATFGGTESTAKLRLVSKESPLVDLRRLVALTGANPGYETKGVLAADVTAEGPMSKLAFTGSVAIRGLEIKGKEWKTAVRSPALAIALTPQSVQAKPFTVEAGGTRLTGAFQVDNYVEAARLNAEVSTSGADLAELIHMAQAFGFSPEGVSGEGKVAVDIKVRGPLNDTNALDLSGVAALNGVTLRLPSLTKPLTIAKANASFRENSVAIDNASVAVAGMNLAGRVTVRNFSAPLVDFAIEADRLNPDELSGLVAETKAEAKADAKPSVLSKMSGGGTLKAGTLQLTNLVLTQVTGRCQFRDGRMEIKPLTATLFGGAVEGAISGDFRQSATTPLNVDVRMARVDANKLLSATTPAKQVIFGAFGADSKLSLRAGDPDALVKSLNGTLDFKLENGKIVGVNLLNEIANVARFLGYAKQDTAFTNVVLLGGTLVLRDGVATTNNLALELDGAKIASAGTIDLVNQKLNLRMTATLSKELSERVGGNQVGGFMATALANESRQLVVPVIVTGPLAGPKVTPDAEQFAQIKLKSLTPSKVVDTITAIKGSEDKLKGVLDIFRKKKDAKEEPKPAVPEK